MIEEPYRWVEAIANRREYIETQLAPGAPVVALQYAGGILLFTAGGTQKKIFEIYDRIAMGAVGHPGDVERLRLAAIELASSEGFTRSAADVSLRRLAYFSLSPLMKSAFEQIYGAPFLARLLFVELGSAPAEDLLLELEFDGSITPARAGAGEAAAGFAVLAGTRGATDRMREYLRQAGGSENRDEAAALALAARACAVGRIVTADAKEIPAEAAIIDFLRQAGTGATEAAVLERGARSAICYRPLEGSVLHSIAS